MAFKVGHVSTEWGKGFAPEIIIGNVVCSGGIKILELDGNLMIGFHPPEEPSAPPRLIARFFGRDEIECFRIEDNQCIGNPDSWDIESTGIESGGWRWKIRNEPRKIDLHLEIFPPHKIVIKQMYWHYGSLLALASSEGLQLAQQKGPNEIENILLLKDMTVESLQEEHCFLKVNREIQVLEGRRINLKHHIAINHMKFDGGGVGTFSMDPNEKIIKI